MNQTQDSDMEKKRGPGRLSALWKSEEWKRQGERFGLGLATALAVMAAISMYRGNMERMETLAMTSAVLLAFAFLLPRALFPAAWLLETAFKTMTKTLMFILLVLVFIIVFAPAGIILRILRKDPLLQRLEPGAPSYWEERKSQDPSRAEKQF